MNNLLNDILQSSGGGLVDQLSSKFGLDKTQATSAIAGLIPAISQGIKSNIADDNGADKFAQALSNGNHTRYVEDANLVDSEEAKNDGNAILGHLFGSKDVSRNVASAAAQKTGVDSSILKQMLPMVATMAMGSLSKQQQSGGLLSSVLGSALGGSQGSSSASGGIGGLLGGLASSIFGGNKNAAAQTGGQSNQLLGALGGFLDSDGDGDITDDLISMISKKAA